MLDEFEAAHALVGGTRASRRFARQQIAQAYVVLLCSQFQKFCRELHSEAAEWITRSAAHDPVSAVLRPLLTRGRRLDNGNASPASLGSDFGRLGIEFWIEVDSHHPRNAERKRKLEELIGWRNAIAHQDFRNPALQGADEVQIAQVRRWRRACDVLTVEIDAVLRLYLQSLMGGPPW
ncbi:MAG TPA: HEPN domain-containing protein [Longimicrobium sp.]|nr:HEPN domain-containing protein [Longimicrobium sp.]